MNKWIVLEEINDVIFDEYFVGEWGGISESQEALDKSTQIDIFNTKIKNLGSYSKSLLRTTYGFSTWVGVPCC